MFYGCLLLLPLILLVIVVLSAITLFSRFATLLGALVVYLWDSFTNLFRSEANKKPTVNPFDAFRSDFDDEDGAPTAQGFGRYTADTESTTPRKLFDKSDGEYIDFEEIKD